MPVTEFQRSELIANKLRRGMKFGLYQSGRSCYMADGMKLNYDELWAIVRQIKELKPGHNATLAELYPDSFLGMFSYRFRFKWLKMGASLFKLPYRR